MKHQAWVWVGGFASIFLFLPSLAIKIWRYVWTSSWQFKSILIYGLAGIILIGWVRWRMIRRYIKREQHDADMLLKIVQRRLAEGKISLEEYRQIKQELQ